MARARALALARALARDHAPPKSLFARSRARTQGARRGRAAAHLMLSAAPPRRPPTPTRAALHRSADRTRTSALSAPPRPGPPHPTPPWARGWIHEAQMRLEAGCVLAFAPPHPRRRRRIPHRGSHTLPQVYTCVAHALRSPPARAPEVQWSRRAPRHCLAVDRGPPRPLLRPNPASLGSEPYPYRLWTQHRPQRLPPGQHARQVRPERWPGLVDRRLPP